MKKTLFIFPSLLIAIMAVHGCKDTVRTEKGARRLEARLSIDEEWRDCSSGQCAPPPAAATSVRCTDSGDSARAVLDFLISQPQCADEAIAAIRRVTPEDLSAAYLLRAERDGRPEALLYAIDVPVRVETDTVRFNRALAFEKLLLPRRAIAAWNDYLRHDRTSAWAGEARKRRDQLKVSNGLALWAEAQKRLDAAIAQRDVQTTNAIVGQFASPTRGVLEKTVLETNDYASAQFLAEAIDRFSGDSYARDIVQAAMKPRSQDAWERGRTALSYARTTVCDADQYTIAERAFTEAASPLRFEATIALLGCGGVGTMADAQPYLARIEAASRAAAPYPHVRARLAIIRGLALTTLDHNVESIEAYEQAQSLFRSIRDNAGVAEALGDLSGVHGRLGDHDGAFALALSAVRQLPSVTNPQSQNKILGAAMLAAKALRQSQPAFEYQRENLALMQWANAHRPHPRVTQNLAIALRSMADLEIGADERNAGDHLALAASLSNDPRIPAGLRQSMRVLLLEVQGRSALHRADYRAAIRAADEALAIMRKNDSATAQATHLLQRATANRFIGNEEAADRDHDEALRVIREEETALLNSRERGEREDLLSSYFARFGDEYRKRAHRLIEDQQSDEAFRYSEEAHGLEPLFLILQSQNVPPAFARVGTATDAPRLRAALPAGAVVIQYMVMEERTYAFIFSRDEPVEVAALGPGREQIRGWVEALQTAAVRDDRIAFTNALGAPFEQLIDVPLARALRMNARPRPLVIVPDGPMHGLPFPALYDSRKGHYLIESAPLAIAGSARLFIYSVMRDQAIPQSKPLRVELFGNPDTDPKLLAALRLDALDQSQDEIDDLVRLYSPLGKPHAKEQATAKNFLAYAPASDIFHFAGHAVADAQAPFRSFLVLAGSDVLTANDILKSLTALPHTRLVVLGSCSSAGGLSRGLAIGPEGMAPLVRPFIAANVPAVLGTLWNVKDDDTTRELLVSFHRHYQQGADVTVALQQAQLEMLRSTSADIKSALAWGGFQVIGYATSPFASSARTEERQSEHLHSQNSLQRPDGLHSQ